ncbi:MAG: hypothetical protein HY216_04320 [Candidatus Rokubacteria bacterium]|nr:hypothetical protein [Candidatus Rokubacteria bacterium]
MNAPADPLGASRPATQMPAFVQALGDFVGFDAADAAAVRASAPLVLAQEAALTAALYDHFLKFPAAARFFLGEDGTPDLARLERRKHSLGRWLRETAEAALTADVGYYLLSVGIAHAHRQQASGAIPLHLMVGAMSLAQTALANIFAEALPAPDALAASRAWNKLLLVHLAVMMLGYEVAS